MKSSLKSKKTISKILDYTLSYPCMNTTVRTVNITKDMLNGIIYICEPIQTRTAVDTSLYSKDFYNAVIRAILLGLTDATLDTLLTDVIFVPGIQIFINSNKSMIYSVSEESANLDDFEKLLIDAIKNMPSKIKTKFKALIFVDTEYMNGISCGYIISQVLDKVDVFYDGISEFLKDDNFLLYKFSYAVSCGLKYLVDANEASGNVTLTESEINSVAIFTITAFNSTFLVGGNSVSMLYKKIYGKMHTTFTHARLMKEIRDTDQIINTSLDLYMHILDKTDLINGLCSESFDNITYRNKICSMAHYILLQYTVEGNENPDDSLHVYVVDTLLLIHTCALATMCIEKGISCNPKNILIVGSETYEFFLNAISSIVTDDITDEMLEQIYLYTIIYFYYNSDFPIPIKLNDFMINHALEILGTIR